MRKSVIAGAGATAVAAAIAFLVGRPTLDERLVAWLPAPNAVDARCRPVTMTADHVGVSAIGANVDFHLFARNSVVSGEMLVDPPKTGWLFPATISRVEGDAIWFEVDRGHGPAEEPLFFRNVDGCHTSRSR